MKNLKFVLIYLFLLIKKRRSFFLSVLLVSFILAFFLIVFSDKISHPSITEGIIGTYRQEDLPEIVTNLLSQSLVKIDKTGLAKPNLVTGWEVSEDGKTYKFKLKDNLFWSDKTKIKASDIGISLPDIETKALTEDTFEIKIADSFSPFPTLLTRPIFKKGTEIGIGPYQIKGIQKDQIFVKKLSLKTDNLNLPDITIRFYPNEKIATSAIKIGEVQALLGASDLEELTQQKTLSINSKTNYQQLVTIFYNTQDPFLSDENFRLALSYGAPSIYNETKAKTSLPPSSWAFNSSTREFLDNPIQAKTHLKKVENGKDSKITLTATSFLKEIGERVVQSWNKVGINAVLRVESGIPQNFQALLIAQNIPVDPDQYSLWHSTQVQTNISKISDSRYAPRIDKDLEDGRKTSDLEARKQKYLDFQKVLLDHAPATFLYFPKFNIVYRNKVKEELSKVIPLQLPKLQ